MHAVLPWQWEHSCSAFQEPDNNSGGRVATVSLRWVLSHTRTSRYARCALECLLTSRHIVAQMYKKCKKGDGKDGRAYARGNSSPP